MPKLSVMAGHHHHFHHVVVIGQQILISLTQKRDHIFNAQFGAQAMQPRHFIAHLLYRHTGIAAYDGNRQRPRSRRTHQPPRSVARSKVSMPFNGSMRPTNNTMPCGHGHADGRFRLDLADRMKAFQFYTQQKSR